VFKDPNTKSTVEYHHGGDFNAETQIVYQRTMIVGHNISELRRTKSRNEAKDQTPGGGRSA
jgi:hypothetical protein